MRIPRSLRIGRHKWTVRFVRHIPHSREDEIVLGITYLDERRIDIVMGMSPRMRHEIFLHELFHALAEEHEFSIPHGALNSLADKLETCLHRNGIKIVRDLRTANGDGKP